jgi:hypothetical protein
MCKLNLDAAESILAAPRSEECLMSQNFKDFKFGEWTYDVAGELRKVVEENPYDYYLTDYFDPKESQFIEAISKPQKVTVLHGLIKDHLELKIEYMASKCDLDEINDQFEKNLKLYKIAFIGLRKNATYESRANHLFELEKLMKENIVGLITEETFNLLYGNRLFLLHLNEVISEVVKGMKRVEYMDVLDKDGVLKRCSYIPIWLENAIFHRDKGRCVHCGMDLTRIFNTSNKYHFDHMVPLSKGGTNDPINFQLLCEGCNLSKSNSRALTSTNYFSYW